MTGAARGADGPRSLAVSERKPTTLATKILVAGGFGVGKTTFVGAISEITPVTTEVLQSDRSQAAGDPVLPGKTTTTVAMDFGRITLDHDLVLYLFGTPGQRRFWFMWDQLARGALGVVVLVDVRRLVDSFAVLDFVEYRGLPLVVAVNQFPDVRAYSVDELRDALALRPPVPIYLCDARQPESVKAVLISLVEYALDQMRHRTPALPGR